MPKFEKGSQEARDFMAKIRASRGKPKDPNAPPKKLTKKQQQKALAESAMVKIQQVGEDELIVPQFFAKKLAPSKKKAVRFRLVNPITQERHLATRNGQTVVKISRRPTAETLIIGDDPTPIPLSAFSRADQERVKEQFKAISVNSSTEPNELPKIPFATPKSRGRPTKLPKNIEWFKENAQSIKKAKQEKLALKQAKDADKAKKKQKPPTEPEPEPNIKLSIVEPDEPDTPPIAPENIVLPEPMKPATTADIKDLKKRMDEMVKIGTEEGLDYYAPNSFFFNLIFAGILLKYGNKCFWDSNLASGRNIWSGTSAGLSVVYTDEKMNKIQYLTPIFTDKFIKAFGEHIQGCIKRGEEVIVIPLTLRGFTKENVKDSAGNKNVNYKSAKSGHANMIVFRPKQGIVERFEPHGSKSGLSEGITSQGEITINKVLKTFWEKDMKQYLGKVRFVPPIDICPTKYPKSEGFQAIQSLIGADIFGNQYRGFCGMWSVFFAELVITNPEKTTDELITESLDISKENPEYMLQLIKGYTRLGEVMLSEIYDNLGIKGWKFKLEAVDRNDPSYTGLLHSTSLDISKKMGEYLRQTFTEINARTGEAIAQPKKPEAPKVESKYKNIEKAFKDAKEDAKSSKELDKYIRSLKSMRLSKINLNTLFTTAFSLGMRQFWDELWKKNNLTTDQINNNIYSRLGELLKEDSVKNQPKNKMVFDLADYLIDKYKTDRRANVIVRRAEEIKKMKGSGIIDDLRNTFTRGATAVKSGVKSGIETIKRGYDDAKDFASVVVSGRKDYQPKGRAILKKYGGEIVKSIEIGRDPVLPALKGVLNAISGGEFGKRVEKADYDDLFHLFAVLTLESGKKIMTEKNEVIIISESIPARGEKAEYKMIANVPSITMEQLFSNNKTKMGQKYFTYSAKDNNCQDYLLSLLKSSNIGTEEDFKFIKQNTKQLFEGMPYLRKFANSITGFAAKLDVIISGRGMGGKELEAEIEDIKGTGLEQKKICVKCIKGMCDRCEMCGGRIKTKDVEKFFRDVGKKVIGKKATKKVEDFGEKAGKYITAKKGGLATDLIDYGVPAATAAAVGGLAGLATGGLGGVVGSAAGSKLGKEVIAPALHKATGAGVGGRSAWISLVKKVAKDKGISYKEALSVASAMRKK